ncbi:hypothetical protein DH2020_000530 [Rehmannia glutinosa]|uniref:Alpha/beta hydrolase fold-3 domain-containing protein n=1 Tax=Rehmannia glutinosa TaxID=99300 RepID=A0ABR0XX75_REHGL
MSHTVVDGTTAGAAVPPPHEVDECRGVLRVYSDGSIWRSNKPSFEVPIRDDGSVLWKDVVFDAAHGLQLRLYKPASPSTLAKLPIFYYIHGGGFCIGSRTWPNCQNYCFKLASELEAVVVAPDYRLAPENRLPAAIEDGYAALKWLKDQAVAEEPDAWLADVADFSRVFISGDSAGGNIAHHLAVRLGAGSGELAPVRVRGYVFLAPFFGGTVRTRFEAEGPKEAFLNIDLIDRAEDYAKKLKKWGKKVEYLEFEGQQHGFFTIDPNSEPSKN